MHPFPTAHGARFFLRADFADSPFLNLNFFDDARRTIPFHLSVRRDENLIVVNRRDAAGWRRELQTPMSFDRRPVTVELVFSGRRVQVRVADSPVGTYDALPRPDLRGRFLLRRGFPDLGRIGFVEIIGGADHSSLVIEAKRGAAPLPGGLQVNDALEAVLPGFAPEDRIEAVLSVSGFADPLPAVLRALPFLRPDGKAEHSLAAVLPGRIWASGAQVLELTLTAPDGSELGRTTLTREDLGRRIAQLALAGALQHDDRAALQAIEHSRHAGIGAALTAEARTALAAAASRFGLGSYLADAGGDAAPQAAFPAGQGAGCAADEAAEHFTAAMRREPAQDPLALLDRLMTGLSAPGDRTGLFCRVIEGFALAGRLDELLRYRRTARIPLPGDPPTHDLYTRSLLLPLDYAEGRFVEVTEALWAITPPTPQWLTTPGLGWIMERTASAAPDLDGRLPGDRQRAGMLGAALDFIEARGADYWERTPCLRLIRGFVALLFAADTLAPAERERVLALAGRVYALSPAFWRAVEAAQAHPDPAHPDHAGSGAAATGGALPPELRPVQQAFRQLQALIETGAQNTADYDAPLALFAQLGTLDLPRFRRELFGPLGVRPGAARSGPAPRIGGLDPEDAALRALAFPGGTIALDDGQLADARSGIAKANPAVPRAPFAPLLTGLRTQAAALLAEAPAPDAVADWTRALPALAGEEGRFMGLALPIMLAKGLFDRGRAEEAALLTGTALRLAGSLTDPQALAALRRTSVPRLALDALLRTHGGALAMQDLAVQDLAQALEPLLPPSPGGPVQDLAADLASAADPLQDTLLCLYSCRANLDTRIRTIRETWLPLLAEMGVPALVFVGGDGGGDGDGRREGDVVHLNAPDDYEGLPQKSLALVRWVHEHTSFAHLVKVDDDCFLDPAAWFGDLAHRSVDYYGRRLHRVRGQMDRTWHQAKSRSERGRLELDKSPEPSVYADGGSGYALSRPAMAALLDAAASPAGRQLIHLSFMEDKLVGDLLALRGIRVDSTDYRISVLRRTGPGGPLVAQWENGFLPFHGSGIKLAHLDGDEKMAEVLAGLHAPRPAQAKIWPSYQPVRQGSRSNTLDLVSTPARLAAVNEAPVAVVTCLRNEMFLLPRFLEHYRGLGVTGFLMADNGSDDGSFEYLADQPDVALFAVDTEYSQSRYGVAWQQALIANFRPGRWSLMADADELLFWNLDLSGNLPALLESRDFAGADAARIFMLDMYPQGPLAAADFNEEGPFAQAGHVDRDPFLAVSGSRGPYSDAPVWTSALRHRLIPGSRAELFVAQKIALLKYRPWMRLSAGLHFVSDVRLARRELLFAHFKYNAQFRAKALAEVSRRQHFNNAEEYHKYLALIGEGRDVIHDPAVSVPWREAAFVQHLCAGGRPSE
ncbi:MAG: glycosyltransferase family 2 protein [Pararhodobacter sp.]